MKTRNISAKEVLDIVSAQWATTKDIKLLSQCGENQALRIKKEIIANLKDWKLPTNKIPMSKLVEYLKLDIKYLKLVERDYSNEKQN